MKTFTFTNSVIRVGHNFIYGLLLIILFQSSAMAQFSSLKNGDKVRIFSPDVHAKTLEGTIYGIDSTQLFLDSGSFNFIIPLTSIERLDVSTGTKRHAGIGALSGLMGGAVIGGILGASEYDNYPANGALAGAIVFGPIGLVAGTAFGYLIKTDKWERLPLEVSMDFQSVRTQELSFNHFPVLSLKFSLSRKHHG